MQMEERILLQWVSLGVEESAGRSDALHYSGPNLSPQPFTSQSPVLLTAPNTTSLSINHGPSAVMHQQPGAQSMSGSMSLCSGQYVSMVPMCVVPQQQPVYVVQQVPVGVMAQPPAPPMALYPPGGFSQGAQPPQNYGFSHVTTNVQFDSFENPYIAGPPGKKPQRRVPPPAKRPPKQ